MAGYIKKRIVTDPAPLLRVSRTLIALVAVFATSIFISAITTIFTNIHVASILVYLLVYLLPFILIAQDKNYPLRDIIRWQNFNRVDIHLITIFGTAFVLVISNRLLEIFNRFSPAVEENIEWQRQLLDTAGEFPLGLVILSVVILPSLCEEFLFRGIIQPALIKKTGSLPGIVITSFFFAAIHVNLTAFIPLFLLGLFLGLLAFRAGTFLYSSVAHMLVNGTALLASRLMNAENIKPVQNENTALVMLIILGIFTLLIVLLFRLTPKRRVGEPDMYNI